MKLESWLGSTDIALHLATWQQFGLAFLLGSFTVATWSDLKRLSAQREFRDIWLLFIGVMLTFDILHAYRGEASAQTVCVKWGPIALFSLAAAVRANASAGANRKSNPTLRSDRSLLPSVHVILFYAIAKLLDLVLRSMLARGRVRPVFQDA